MFKDIDSYTVQARVNPVLIVCFPTLFWMAGFFSGDSSLVGLVISLLSFVGLGPLVGQLGRDGGLKKQAALVRQWGGMPTTVLFRYTGSGLRKPMLDALHNNMQVLLPGAPRITEEDERHDLAAADAIYERWANFLREGTRDLHLVQQENINYGFRRNLYGLRTVGIWASLLPLVATMADVWLQEPRTWAAITAMSKVTIAISVFALWFHWRVVTPEWVKIAADAYAKRLVFASDKLVAGKTPQPSASH
jgi:hypothetical protein